MDRAYLDSVADRMRGRGLEVAAGLSSDEIAAAETLHGFRFPPDLRSLLSRAVPVGDGFPDWRAPGSAFIRDRLALPALGIVFDVENNDFWRAEWGAWPAAAAIRERVGRLVADAPFLIPICGQRYMPASPHAAGNPIFSVYQTEVVCHGVDLVDYLRREFGVPDPRRTPGELREIPFWSTLARVA